ncbi:MAG: cell division protein PerM [Actinomycetota bacterium]
MKCPRCGTENAADARFCLTCGEPLSEDARRQVAADRADEPAPPAETPPPEPLVEETQETLPPTEAQPPEEPPVEAPPPRRSTAGEVGAVLALGWPKAVVRGGVAFAVMLLLGAAIVLLVEAVEPSGLSFFEVLKVIGLAFYAFHHAGIQGQIDRLEVPQTPASPFAGPLDFSFTLSVALMLGTFLGLWLLYRGGRSVGLSAGGVAWARALHGAKVAIPYAVLSFAMAFVATFSIDLPQSPFLPTGGPFEFGPSLLAALLWPLGLGILAGGLGGLASGERWISPGGAAARVRAVMRGGLTMTLYALLLAFLGYLVVVALNPDVPLPFSPDFFEAVGSQGLAGLNLLLVTILVVPNIAVWVLVPAMGGSMGFDLAGFSFQFLSYGRFPTGATQIPQTATPVPIPGLPQLETAPAAYFLFLLVPLAATILGGWWAARRAPARSPGDGAAVGAMTGVVFAAAITLLVVLASIGIGFSAGIQALAQSGRGHIGPPILLGALLSLVWGVGGGALGGLLGGRRPSPVAAPSTLGFEGASPAPPPGDTVAEPPHPAPSPEGPSGEEPDEEARPGDRPG